MPLSFYGYNKGIHFQHLHAEELNQLYCFVFFIIVNYSL